MITVYSLTEGQLKIQENFTGNQIPAEAVWIDLLNPKAEEELFVEKSLQIDAPTHQEMKKIEVMSRSYHEGDANYMTATIIKMQQEGYAKSDAITFILTQEKLITVRYSDPRSFAIFAQYAKARPHICKSGESIFEGLLASIINRMADILDKIGEDMNLISVDVFSFKEKKEEKNKGHTSIEFNQFLHEIGRIGDLNTSIRESLLSVDRLLIFYHQACESKESKHNISKIKGMRNDIQALKDQTMSISQESNFLLSATLGMISIQQNNIIKIFSVAATAFLPPTLIASIYGMNFQSMPELEWKFGYPLALVLMLLSAIFPYRYFKKRGWL